MHGVINTSRWILEVRRAKVSIGFGWCQVWLCELVFYYCVMLKVKCPQILWRIVDFTVCILCKHVDEVKPISTDALRSSKWFAKTLTLSVCRSNARWLRNTCWPSSRYVLLLIQQPLVVLILVIGKHDTNCHTLLRHITLAILVVLAVGFLQILIRHDVMDLLLRLLIVKLLLIMILWVVGITLLHTLLILGL